MVSYGWLWGSFRYLIPTSYCLSPSKKEPGAHNLVMGPGLLLGRRHLQDNFLAGMPAFNFAESSHHDWDLKTFTEHWWNKHWAIELISFPYTFQKPFPQYHHRGGGCSCGGYFGEIRWPDLSHSSPTLRSYDGAPTSSLDQFVNFKHKQLRNVSICLDPWYFATFSISRQCCTQALPLPRSFVGALCRCTAPRHLPTSRVFALLVHAGVIDMWQSVYLGSADWFYTLWFTKKWW